MYQNKCTASGLSIWAELSCDKKEPIEPANITAVAMGEGVLNCQLSWAL